MITKPQPGFPAYRRGNDRWALRVERLTVCYDSRAVVRDVSSRWVRGRMHAIIGPNGAGKSTLLKAVVGVTPIKRGTVSIAPMSGGDALAYVPQRADVDWDFPVDATDVVMMGLSSFRSWMPRFRRSADIDQARHFLDKVGLASQASKPIGALSGGQQQRLFIARALAQDADIYLLDEPMAGIDATSEAIIISLLRLLCDQGKTVVCVHHDLMTLAQYFDEALCLNRTAIAQGSIKKMMQRSILEKTYGGTFPSNVQILLAGQAS